MNGKFQFDEKTESLFSAVLELETVEEAAAFFRDLCTVEEIKDMRDRWEIVRLLGEGKTYRKIAEELGTSTTTVSRVANWFKNGQGGYKLILDRVNHHRKNPSVGMKLR